MTVPADPAAPAPAPAGGAGEGAAPPDGSSSPAGGGGEASSPEQRETPQGESGGRPGPDGADTTDGGEDGQEPPRSGPGAEAFEATGALGGGSQRHGHMQNAFANVDGDVVSGSKFVYLLGGQRKRLRPLSRLTQERVRFAYVEPANLPAMREMLLKQHLLILRGDPGTGKTAMAVRLLLAATAGRGPVYHLDSDVDVTSLAALLEEGNGHGDGIERGVGFLLDRPTDIANLGGTAFAALQGALDNSGAWMVLTVHTTGISDSELLPGVVEVVDVPSPESIVHAHLRRRLGDRTATRLLGRDDIRVLVGELDGAPACKHAADLADALCDEYEYQGESAGDELDLGPIRRWRARLEAEEFEIWAENLRDPAIRATALALAVLNGLPRENVARAARSLRERLEGDPRRAYTYLLTPSPDGRLLRPRDPFGAPRRTQLPRLRAHAVPKPGDEPGEVLEYIDAAFSAMVIWQAWTEYEVQDEILDWLGELVTDPAEQVRVYAAVALGVIAGDSFVYLRDRLFQRWAHSKNSRHRDAVAYALSVAARDSWVEGQVTSMVDGWYADRAHPLAQATAARVHGLRPAGDGDARGADAVAALGRLTVVDNAAVAVAVGRSLTDLLADDRELTPCVLRTLCDRALDHRARPAALLCFLIIAAQLTLPAHDSGIDHATVPEWPALLHLANQRDELREPFVWLWREALSQADYHAEAKQVLRGWAALAERDEKLREMFLRMVYALAHRDPRSHRILERYATDWVHPDSLAPLPQMAESVSTQLRELYVRQGRAR
jgi:hypothetical protein